jgi:hypothetical protein
MWHVAELHQLSTTMLTSSAAMRQVLVTTYILAVKRAKRVCSLSVDVDDMGQVTKTHRRIEQLKVHIVTKAKPTEQYGEVSFETL